MADYKRSIRCSGCGNEITVYMNGNFDLTQLSAVGKCPDCRGTIQLDFAMVEKEEPAEAPATEASSVSPMDMFSAPDETEIAEEVSEETTVEEEEDTGGLIKDLMRD